MASHTSLRQASRVVQSSRSYLGPSRIRQYSQSTTSHILLSSRTASFSRHPRIYSHHVLQQSRNLSWWGSGASKPPSTPLPEAAPSSNLDITEPSDLKSIIAPDRSFRASSDISSAELEAQASSTPKSLEPQFLEDVQQAIAEPHFSNPDSLPSNLEAIPERVGYLKEVCGLDFGWGPTSTVQYLLEHLHITGEYSWTVSIVLLGIAVRAIVFPVLITAAKQSQKMRDIKEVIGPIQAEYTAAKAKQDQQKMAKAAQRLIAVKKEFGVQIWKAFLPPLVQIPFGFGCWRLLRNASEVPVPGFVTESWLWTTDLTFSDPYFIAPAISALLIWLTMKSNARVNSNPASESMLVILLKFMPALSFAFMCIQPGAVQLYFISSSTVGLVSALILQQRPVRAYFNMPPLPSATTKIPILSGPSPAKPKGSSAISKAPIAPITVTSTAGGLHRRSIVDRMAEAERAARLAAEEAARNENISTIDKGIEKLKKGGNLFKKHKADLTGAFGKIGEQVGFSDGREERAKKAHESKVESYEAQIQEKLDRQRQARNEKSIGRR